MAKTSSYRCSHGRIFRARGRPPCSPTSSGFLDFGRHGRDPELPPPSMAAFLELVVSVMAVSLRLSRERTGMGVGWRRGGDRKEAGRLVETTEGGGELAEPHQSRPPPRCSRQDEAYRFVSSRFRSPWGRKRAQLWMEFGSGSGNSGRIPGPISTPLQTPEFGSEF
jgi:hypothetical protein